ncbi:hypothetical protein FP2506_12969 [Fulvimarina pelagi HTCC2506]|uniref:Uncharacterized protein n=2 Tax=Fulvimarina pelagi TaxID=217511 RepID=Q0G1A2_9HYPH|nr:hypothetical protein FP2506_12969 [Fulvimarina pelagi HTCC2506]
MGPSFEKGRRRAIIWPLVVVIAAIAIYFLFVDSPGDQTPSDEPLQPATQGDGGETEDGQGEQ